MSLRAPTHLVGAKQSNGYGALNKSLLFVRLLRHSASLHFSQ